MRLYHYFNDISRVKCCCTWLFLISYLSNRIYLAKLYGDLADVRHKKILLFSWLARYKKIIKWRYSDVGTRTIRKGRVLRGKIRVTVRRYTDDSKHSPLNTRGKLCSTARRSIFNHFNFIVKLRYKEFKGNYAFLWEI